MPRGLARLFRGLLPATSILLVLASRGYSAELVRLERWAETASLFKNRGPGREYFELFARTHWPRKVAGAYAVRVRLPDGSGETRTLTSDEGPGGQRITVLVPAAAVRNLKPAELNIQATVIDSATGAQVSNVLSAGIEDFPHPSPAGAVDDPGPFGWGTPLEFRAGEAQPLRRPGPDDWEFVRIPPGPNAPDFYIATTEATNAQVVQRLKGYDPRTGRSDDFELDDPSQPAIGLTPDQARAYLRALSATDPTGLVYRLPTRDEWLRAASGGRATPFWWGAEPAYPLGANFHGPEPALKGESTASIRPPGASSRFKANPWGLFHTFGNVAEWAVAPTGGFVQLGGNFRTEPESPLPELSVPKGNTTGQNPYVGVRPVFSLDARAGKEIIRKALAGDSRLAPVEAAFDPDRGTATLTGTLPESTLRRLADTRLEPLWFLAAVENRIETPKFAPGQLASLDSVVGPIRRITPLGRWLYEVPVGVRWGGPLPVEGSDWWVNVYLPGGASFSHRLVELRPGTSKRVSVMIDRAKMAATGLRPDAAVSVALSLGKEAPNPGDPQVVTNVFPLHWRLP